MLARGSVLALMRELAAGPEGVSNAQLQERLRRGSECCAPLLSAACSRGHLFASRRPGARTRWFDTAERASAWAVLPAMVPSEWSLTPAKPARTVDVSAEVKQARTNALKREAAHKAQPIAPKRAMPAPVHVKDLWTKPAGDEVDYSHAKLTVCPSPGYGMAARLGVAPGQGGSFGAGFAAVGVGRDVQTGRAWG